MLLGLSLGWAPTLLFPLSLMSDYLPNWNMEGEQAKIHMFNRLIYILKNPGNCVCLILLFILPLKLRHRLQVNLWTSYLEKILLQSQLLCLLSVRKLTWFVSDLEILSKHAFLKIPFLMNNIGVSNVLWTILPYCSFYSFLPNKVKSFTGVHWKAL